MVILTKKDLKIEFDHILRAYKENDLSKVSTHWDKIMLRFFGMSKVKGYFDVILDNRGVHN